MSAASLPTPFAHSCFVMFDVALNQRVGELHPSASGLTSSPEPPSVWYNELRSSFEPCLSLNPKQMGQGVAGRRVAAGGLQAARCVCNQMVLLGIGPTGQRAQ